MNFSPLHPQGISVSSSVADDGIEELIVLVNLGEWAKWLGWLDTPAAAGLIGLLAPQQAADAALVAVRGDVSLLPSTRVAALRCVAELVGDPEVLDVLARLGAPHAAVSVSDVLSFAKCRVDTENVAMFTVRTAPHVDVLTQESERVAESADRSFLARLSSMNRGAAQNFAVLFERAGRIVDIGDYAQAASSLLYKALSKPAMVCSVHTLQFVEHVTARLGADCVGSVREYCDVVVAFAECAGVSVYELRMWERYPHFEELSFQAGRRLSDAVVSELRQVCATAEPFSKLQTQALTRLALFGCLSDDEVVGLFEKFSSTTPVQRRACATAVLQAAIADGDRDRVLGVLRLSVSTGAPTALSARVLVSEVLTDVEALLLWGSATSLARAHALVSCSPARQQLFVEAFCAEPVLFGDVDAELLKLVHAGVVDPCVVDEVVGLVLASPSGVRKVLASLPDGPVGVCAVALMVAMSELCGCDVGRWATFSHVAPRHAGSLSALRSVITTFS